jgi:prolyl oligopeptidase
MPRTRFRYPEAPRQDLVQEMHGELVADPYRWIEDAADLRTARWLRDQEELFLAESRGWPGRDDWHRRLAQLTAVPITTAPKVRGEKVFTCRQDPGMEHPAIFVARATEAGGTGDGAGRLLLDVSALDPSGSTVLDAWEPSPDGRLLACQLSSNGTEDSELTVIDTVTGATVDGPIGRLRQSPVAWLPGGEMFYYVRRLPPGPHPGEERYHRRVYLHQVGHDPDSDILIFGDGRGKTQFYTVAVCADGRWLTITATAGTSPRADVYLADLSATGPGAPELRPVHEGIEAKTRVHIAPGTGPLGPIWLHTDYGAPRGRVVTCGPAGPAASCWRELIAERPDAVLEDFAVLTGPGLTRPVGLAAWTRHAAAEITVHDLADGRQTASVPLPGAGVAGRFSVRPEGGHEAWFSFHSNAVTPRVYRYDARRGETTLWAGGGPAIAGTAGPAVPAVAMRQVAFSSADGTRVHMFVVSPAGHPDRPRPAILTGYGGFGVSMSPGYSPVALAWAAAGGVFATACLRGGGEEGQEWHRAGMGENKPNVFDDFAAAADHLVTDGWTAPGQLAIMGGSNGGLLVGAALTRHPEKYAAVICMSPLLDMVRYELSGLGPSWRPEYGSASDPAQLRTLLSYSPYHRVRDGIAYPPVLFTVSDGDTRVDPLHARKMCAALQHASAAPGPVLFRLERGAGHGTRARSRQVGLFADCLAFLGGILGLAAA